MPSPATRRGPVPVAVLVVFAALAVVFGPLAEPAAGLAGRPGAAVAYEPPVDAPVVDPFRPPSHPYGPGNRGLTYDLAPATPVRAAAPGTVVFAGPVGGTDAVTVLHADGLRTSYSFLSRVDVRRGQQVGRGDVVGAAGVGFHLGARDGDTYIDPADLFDGVVVHVRLVPHAEPVPSVDVSLQREHAALRELVRGERRGLLSRALGAVGDVLAPVAGRFVDVATAVYHTWSELQPKALAANVGRALGRHIGRECTSPDQVPEPPPGERTALLVAGLGSSSDHGSIDDVDLAALGYAPDEVLRYSYGGGRVPSDGLHPDLAGIPAADYDSADTQGDIEARGRELATLIDQAAAARPGVPVDLYAHSLGGLVTRVALQELADRGRLDVLGEVVTIASPHAGADLATVAVLSEQGFGSDVGFLRERFGIEVDPYSPAVRQMAESSRFIAGLRDAGVPDGVRFRTVGARGDLVVLADKTMVQGHPAAVVESFGFDAHSSVTSDPHTTHELLLGLAGLPPRCRGLGDVLADALAPTLLRAATDGFGLATFIVG